MLKAFWENLCPVDTDTDAWVIEDEVGMMHMMRGLSESLFRVQNIVVYRAGVGMGRKLWLLFELMKNYVSFLFGLNVEDGKCFLLLCLESLMIGIMIDHH